jgi:hypothetical protein
MASSLLNGNPSDLETFEKAAAKGNRVVLGFRPASLQRFRSPDAVEQRWSVRIESRGDPREESPVYFASAKDWRVVRNSGGRATELERAFGRGSIVLLADGHALTNGGLAQGGAGERIAALLGTYTRAVFDEHHLGVQQSGSIMALARRYRLHGFFLGALVVAALFVWKSSSVFPPPPPITQGAALSGRDAVAGFVSLLRRNIPADEVAGLCWNEWRRTEGRTIPSARLAKADQIMKGGAGIENLNAAREVLYRK